jgi:hypothetical protein
MLVRSPVLSVALLLRRVVCAGLIPASSMMLALKVLVGDAVVQLDAAGIHWQRVAGAATGGILTIRRCHRPPA